jgi:tetratricopeptide (TPR) repeat protein
VADQLNVEMVVEGSVRRIGNRIRLSAELINAREGFQVWSERYDRDVSDIFAIQDELSRAVVQALRLKLTPGQTGGLADRQTENLEAYNLYLKGRFFLNRRGSGLTLARQHLLGALRLDPGYTRALAALADTYNLLGWYRVEPPDATFPEAIGAATKALSLNPDLAEAHTSLGFARTFYEWDWRAAEAAFLRAIELNPSYPTAHHWYSELLMVLGRFEAAVGEAEAAQRLDPLAQINNVLVAMAHYMSGSAERAVDESRRIIDLDPGFVPAFQWLVRGCIHLGDYDGAIEAARREMSLASGYPSLTRAFHGMALGLGGRREEAAAVLAELEADASGRFTDSLDLAFVSLGLGERSRALDLLERAVEQRSGQAPFLAVDPLLKPVRDEPRFQALLRRVGLAA